MSGFLNIYHKNARAANNTLVGSRLHDYQRQEITRAIFREMEEKGYVNIEVTNDGTISDLQYVIGKGLQVREDYVPDVISELERQDFNIRQFGFTKFMATPPKRDWYFGGY